MAFRQTPWRWVDRDQWRGSDNANDNGLTETGVAQTNANGRQWLTETNGVAQTNNGNVRLSMQMP